MRNLWDDVFSHDAGRLSERPRYRVGRKIASGMRAGRGWSVASAILLWSSFLALAMLLLLSGALAHADTVREHTGSLPLSSTVTNREICLTAGDHGPFFSLRDLQNYVPRPTPPTWKIKPPVWKEYPVDLDKVPLAPREYSSETVNYMAMHEIHYGDRNVPYVALTFDCEAGTASTLQILKTLRRKDVKATFFVLGRYVYRNPEIVREIAKDGHEFGSHSFFHPLFTNISSVTATQEITYTEAAVAWAVGEYVPMRYLRFPYGGRNYATRLHAATWGYQSAFWDLDPRGWEPEKTAEDVVEYIRQTAHAGGIVIMHCSCLDDVKALPDVIQAIREKGLSPGKLSDVLTDKDRNVPGYAVPSFP
jgi:peptidoglycan/xylan/chitin deacetylase (PgdA/CDA1 family)